MIDAFCSQIHYIEHIGPILRALPEGRRGVVYLGVNDYEYGPICDRLGVAHAKGRPPGNGEPVLIAGGADLPHAEGRPVVFVEHGAGQTYKGQAHDVCYTGGRGRDRVILFLTPNQQVADGNLAVYPAARAAVIGDPTIRPVDWVRGDPPVVGVTFHWDLDLVPETRWTWPNWAYAILHLAQTFEVLGHAHPKAQHLIFPWYEEHRIMCTDRLDVVMDVGDVLVVDNSSAGPEFARTGRPIVWLNANHYRRDVHHGGRFWEWTKWAYAADDPDDADGLVWTVTAALADPDDMREARTAATAAIYPYVGAGAAARAVDAILSL